MTVAIFDLDYTLFDAKKFRAECLSHFFSMSAVEFEVVYQQNKKANQHFDINILLERYQLSEKNFDDYLKKEINKYFYPGVEKILKLYRQQVEKLVLATFGNISWQRKKISFMQIGEKPFIDFFDKIILEDKDKSDSLALQEFIGQEVEIINDNEGESLKLLKIFGESVKLHLIRGPYSKSGFRDINELGSAIFPKAYYNEDKV